ncbi:unnamed protein product [Nyctereutes procyonoides]|uniref:dihydrofolate reductase n=1 Tax=Nyctereutes procyonoides TaxID=34880 RepID=A0A811ZL02_NYCPR|nr:unnamed protein product [Nyctereutes procyonoides]
MWHIFFKKVVGAERGGRGRGAARVRTLNRIVTVSQDMGIRRNGDLPWPPLRNEFKYFQRMTTNSSLEGKQNLAIMGWKTWFSIPEKNRPLKDRINIVLSRDLKEPPQGAHFLAKSLDDALKLTEQPELANKVDMDWIVGGSSVYKEAMNKPGHLRLFVTRIMHEFESDTFFPEIDWRNINFCQNTQVFFLMSRRRKALSTNLKYMRRKINVKIFFDLFQVSSPPRQTILSVF